MALVPSSLVGAPASGANVCPPRSHRGGPAIRRCSYNKPATTSYRRSTRLGCEYVPAPLAPGRCSYNKPPTAPYRRSTRTGCECVPAPFAPGAVLLQTHLPPPRIVGAPVSGANACQAGSHRGGAPTNTPATTPYRRSTRLG